MQRLRVVSILAAGLVAASCESAPQDVPPVNAEEEILAQERAGLDQWAAGKPLGYTHSAAEDVTYFDDIAAADRIEGLEAWKSYVATLEVPPHQYEIIDPMVQVYGDVGILTLHYQGMGLEGEVLARWKATSVYRYDAGEWRTVHAHWSMIKED